MNKIEYRNTAKSMTILQRMAVSALLIALGTLIPLISPFKIAVEPISFTLASHVPLFLAMFVSPSTALAVALGTTFGFFLNPYFHIVIVFRAASHIIFALLGAFYLKKKPETLKSPLKIQIFSFIIGIIHGLFEALVVTLSYFGGISTFSKNTNIMFVILVIIGVGSIVHSMVDFIIARIIYKGVSANKHLSKIFIS